MISFLSLFYLPGNENIKIITIKHLLVWMICTEKILFLKNVQLKYQKGKQMLYLFENKQKEQFFSELPLHYHTKLNPSESVEISVASWFKWLDDVSQLIHYECLFQLFRHFQEQQSYRNFVLLIIDGQ